MNFLQSISILFHIKENIVGFFLEQIYSPPIPTVFTYVATSIYYLLLDLFYNKFFKPYILIEFVFLMKYPFSNKSIPNIILHTKIG